MHEPGIVPVWVSTLPGLQRLNRSASLTLTAVRPV